MKTIPVHRLFNRLAGWLVGLNCFIATLPLGAQSSTPTTLPGLQRPPITITTRLSTAVKPYPVLTAMQRVADWQLAHPFTNCLPTDWQLGTEYAGMMALAGISGDVKYRNAMLAMGENNQWQTGPRQYSADDHCVGQTYAELYLLYRENKMIAPLRERFDFILANPPDAQSLDFTQPQGKALEVWSWCDSLFMGPPAWLRLYTATGDERYLNFAVTNWWRTTDYLYDTNDHLFYRDSTYFDKREVNGQKVFWSRGNGWVMAGLVRVLQYLPTNHPDRPRFEQLFKDMAAKIVTLQQPDGLWQVSLLDPADYPEKETSGSGFFIYALAWGVNQGLLDHMKFEPAVRKGWAALVVCVGANGKLMHVQPVGSDPKKFAEDSTAPYGVGAFLLAGSEVYRMVILKWKQPERSTFAPPPPDHVIVKITNPAEFPRDCETIELDTVARTEINGANGEHSGNYMVGTGPIGMLAAFGQLVVMDVVSSRILDSQFYFSPVDARETNHKLLFQVDLAPHETRTYYVLDASALAVVPPPIIKTFARYVPERYDDFAWESDRITHRAYGIPLIKAEGTISSGPDVWIKKDRGLIVDTMYKTGHYHEDNGSFMDDYRVGHSRGCGGLGIWDGKKLHTSSNYRSWKLITTGPIRSEFELTYDAWDAGNGRMVSETKRYRIDAGSWFTRAQSTFNSDDKSPLTIGVGLAERACPTNRVAFVADDQSEGWMSYWQPEDKPKGIMGVAIVLPKGSVTAFTNDAPNMPDSVLHAAVPQPTHEGYPAIRNMLAITQVQVGQPFSYDFGACWDRSGDFTNDVQWEAYVKRFTERRDQPLQVTVGN